MPRVPAALCALALVSTACSGGDDAEPERAQAVPAEWAAVADAPTARQEVAAAAVGGRVWVVGGFVDGAASTLVEVYDPATDTWQRGPDLPHPVHHAMAAESDGLLHVAGGFGADGQPTDRAFRLAGGADRWEELPRMPVPRGAGAAATASRRLVVVGGVGPLGHVDRVAIFDGADWSQGRSIPTGRDHLAAASDGSYLYAVGGRVGSLEANVDALERYDPAADEWEDLPDMPTARGGLGAAFLGGLLVVAGGESPGGTNEEVEAFDPESGGWSSLPPMPTPRHGLGTAVVDNVLYALVGGTVPGFGADATVEALRLS